MVWNWTKYQEGLSQLERCEWKKTSALPIFPYHILAWEDSMTATYKERAERVIYLS